MNFFIFFFNTKADISTVYIVLIACDFLKIEAVIYSLF